MVDEPVKAAPAPKARLRPHLRLSVMPDASERRYLIEDVIATRYYRIGEREYEVVNSLSEFRSLGEAYRATNERLGDRRLTESEFQAVVEWLQTERLLEFDNAELSAPETRSKSVSHWLNLITFRIPLGNPDQLIDKIFPSLRFFTSSWFFTIWILACASALIVVAINWNAFSDAAAGIFYVDNWLSLIGLWVSIKVTHELFHGIVCKKYGGNVYETGVILILFIPIGYVDATSSWRFPNKWHRIYTALAGMYIELFLAAVAAWVWLLSDPGILNDLAYKAIVLASITTLMFNANPLMRFDGYFALSDAMNTPNLYAHGRRYVFYLVRRYLLGYDDSFTEHGLDKPRFVKLYGILSLVWRVVVIASLLIAAEAMFYGAGVIIAASAFIAMVAMPFLGNLRSLSKGRDTKALLKAAGRSIVLISSAIMIAFVVTWRDDVVAPALVDFADHQIIRAQTAGFVEHIAIKSGDMVAKGDLLIRLDNPELAQQRRELTAEIEQAKLRIRIRHSANRMADVKNERRGLQQLQRELSAVAADIEALSIRAPAAGEVFAEDLSSFHLRFINVGERIAELMETRGKTVQVSIDQRSMDLLELAEGVTVPLRFPAMGPTVIAEIERVEPRLSRKLAGPGLAGAYGGPIPVRLNGAASAGERDREPYEYLDPRGSVVARLDEVASEALYAGEVGYAQLPGARISLAQFLVTKLETWVTTLVRRAERS